MVETRKDITPMKRRTPAELDGLLESVRARAGTWVLVDEFASSAQARNFAAFLRARRRNGPGFQFASRYDDVDGGKVYRVWGFYKQPKGGSKR